jgi:hypothetical protein
MIRRGLMIALGLFSLTFASTAIAASPEDFIVQVSNSTLPIEDTDMAMEAIADGKKLTRGEFTALIVEKLYTQADLDRCFWDIASKFPPHFTLIFTDVHVNDQFSKHICVAMRDGLISGYGDGSFRPERQINFAEAAKIISRARGFAPYAHMDRFSPWYRAHVQALAERNAIPVSIDGLSHLVTTAEANEIMARILGGITSRPSRTSQELEPKPLPRKPAPTQKPTPSSQATSSAASSQGSAASHDSESSEGSFWDFF